MSGDPTLPRPDEQDPAAVAARLATPLERIFTELEPLQAALADLLGQVVVAGRRPACADLAGLRDLADRVTDGDRLLVGAGVVLEPGLLADADRHLVWRQRGADGTPADLLLDVDPASEDPYDYPQMEWFRVPREEGRRMIGGPYFDYQGADRFALTVAVPVRVAEGFVGVAGADVPLGTLEAELLPILRRLPRRAALLNHENRVVTANTPSYATGTRVRPGHDPDTQLLPVVTDLHWTLLLGPLARTS